MNGKFFILTLSFGGNQPETKRCFQLALDMLSDKVGTITLISSLYRSEAWGMKEDTADFLNQVVQFKTKKTPQEVLKISQHIERKLGRMEKSKESYQNRPIDIDILFFDQVVIQQPHLTIPHYLIHKRQFILKTIS